MQLWPEKGSMNTEGTIEAAMTRAKELGIKYIIVASNSGKTAQMLANKGFNIVCVSHHVGFAKPGDDEMGTRSRRLLQELGVKVLTTTHLFAGIDRAMRNHFQGIYPAEIVAGTLRLFGQGIKVCVEISIMALDAGLIPYGKEVIAIGGSAKGADAACVIEPAHSSQFFDTKVLEIICMPRSH
jgi:hypothetical protein